MARGKACSYRCRGKACSCRWSTVLYRCCGAEPLQSHPATCQGSLAQLCELRLGAGSFLTLQWERSEPRFAIRPSPTAPWTPLKGQGWKGFPWGRDGSGAMGLVPSLKGVCRADSRAGSASCLHWSISITTGGRESPSHEVFVQCLSTE